MQSQIAPGVDDGQLTGMTKVFGAQAQVAIMQSVFNVEPFKQSAHKFVKQFEFS